MKKILIIMDSVVQTQQLNEQLSGLFYVVTCNNGLDGLDVIKEFDPDVIVLDLALSGIDGISLLELAWDCGIRPKIIAITTHISDYVVASLEHMNTCCLLRGACESNQLVSRIIDVAYWQDSSVQSRQVDTILASLSFKMNASGCRITKTALEMFAKDPTQKVTTQLYPAVARACDGTATQVEKAIRDSIDSAWEDRNERVWRLYFDACKNGKLVKPSNREFLARISRCIADREDAQNRKIG